MPWAGTYHRTDAGPTDQAVPCSSRGLVSRDGSEATLKKLIVGILAMFGLLFILSVMALSGFAILSASFNFGITRE